MIKFKFFKYPVEVHFTFLLLAAFLGYNYLNSGNYTSFLEVAVILFVSIFVHELGHALMFSRYNVNSRIQLYGMGGLCYPDRNVTHKSNVFVSLAGPFAGFALAGIYWLIMKYSPLPAASLDVGTRNFLIYFTTIGYGLLNLLPIFPLDGGHALKSFLIAMKVPRASKAAFVVSIVFLVAAAAGTVYYKQYIMLVVVLWLASDNFSAMKAEKS